MGARCDTVEFLNLYTIDQNFVYALGIKKRVGAVICIVDISIITLAAFQVVVAKPSVQGILPAAAIEAIFNTCTYKRAAVICGV